MSKSNCDVTRALLVGMNSFLAREVQSIQSDDLILDAVSHSASFASIDVDSYDVVINMAYAPSFMRQPYQEETDFDLAVARQVAKFRSHYVMMSTRRVYGSAAPFHITEECNPEPVEHYGRNKLRTERAVYDLLGSKCTVLRVANVFGFEPGRHTFFGIALQSLKQSNRILLDVSPFVKRDFLYIQDFAQLLRRILVHRPQGIYNLGSGCATQLGRIALGIIMGYQSGELVVTSPVERDGFELDIQKLTSRIGWLDSPIDIHSRCVEIGRKLKDA